MLKLKKTYFGCIVVTAKMDKIIRCAIDRKTRAVKRSRKRESYQVYMKRQMITDKICHYIVFPVVFSAIGKPNDFYFHSLSQCWNDKNISKNYPCRELLRGLHWKDVVEIDNLPRSAETGWFTSSRKNDLAKIGKVAGIFLRRFACSVGQALDDNFILDRYSHVGDKDLTDLINELKEIKTVEPVIVKLEISPHSNFDASKFICLSEDHVNMIISGDEKVVTRRVKVLKITSGLHDWTWRLLNLPTLESREQLLIDGIPNPVEGLPERVENENCEARVCHQIQGRPVSSRLKRPNTRYISEIFDMN